MPPIVQQGDTNGFFGDTGGLLIVVKVLATIEVVLFTLTALSWAFDWFSKLFTITTNPWYTLLISSLNIIAVVGKLIAVYGLMTSSLFEMLYSYFYILIGLDVLAFVIISTELTLTIVTIGFSSIFAAGFTAILAFFTTCIAAINTVTSIIINFVFYLLIYLEEEDRFKARIGSSSGKEPNTEDMGDAI